MTVPVSQVISAKPRCARRRALERKSFLDSSTWITWPCSVYWNSSLLVFIPFAVPSLPVPLCCGHGEAHTGLSLCPWAGSGAVVAAGTRKEAAACSQGYVSPFFELSKSPRSLRQQHPKLPIQAARALPLAQPELGASESPSCF